MQLLGLCEHSGYIELVRLGDPRGSEKNHQQTDHKGGDPLCGTVWMDFQKQRGSKRFGM